MARKRRANPRSTGMVEGWRRPLMVGVGCVFVALGAIGVVLPGIPTTPFLLVASYFFLQSSPGLHRKLLESRTFGPMLRDWQEHRGLRPRVKITALVGCTLAVALSIAFGGLPWPGKALIAIAGAYGLWFVSRLPVVPSSDQP